MRTDVTTDLITKLGAMLFTGLNGSTNAGAVYSRPVGFLSILNPRLCRSSFADLTW